MRTLKRLTLLMIATALMVTFASCCGPRYCAPQYACTPFYTYPADYSVFQGPAFVQPVAYSYAGWYPYSRAGYFPVGYVSGYYGSCNMVGVLHDYAP